MNNMKSILLLHGFDLSVIIEKNSIYNEVLDFLKLKRN